MPLKIRMYGDPILREKSRPIGRVDESVRRLAQDMLETMRAQHGVGLAAQQIGRTDAICVVELPPEFDRDEQGQPKNPGVTLPLVLLNPEIVESSSSKEPVEEGCLSFPGITASVPRATNIRVRFQDLDGKDHDLPVRDYLARVIQHELDHLNGVLFIDRMSRVKRIALAGPLRRMKRETEEALGLK